MSERIRGLYERADELSFLAHHLQRASEGHGRVLLVTADAGYGKTRLMEEVALRAQQRGTPVLRGQAVPGCGAFRPVGQAVLAQLRGRTLEAPELGAFRPVLARLLPEWNEDQPDAGGVDPLIVMGEALIHLLRVIAPDTGCLVVLEDLHWADGGTLGLLEYLAASLEGTPALVVGTARSDEVAPPPLRRLRNSRGVLQLVLGPLSDAAVRAVAAGRLGHQPPKLVEDYLVARAEGSPLMTEELADGLLRTGALRRTAEGWATTEPSMGLVPDTLAEVVRDRLCALSDEERTVLHMTAVLGPTIRPELIAKALALHEGPVLAGLRAGVEQHLLAADPVPPNGLRWRHALTREAVLAGLVGPDRTALARQAAQALSGASTVEDVALAALLHEAAGLLVQAAQLNVALARRAASSGALETAMERLTAAERLAGDDATTRLETLCEVVRVLAATGQVEEALRRGGAALAVMVPEGRTELALAMSSAAVRGDRFAEAATLLHRYVSAADPRSQALAAHIAFGTGKSDEAAELAARAAEAGTGNGMPDVTCEALEILGRHARLTDIDAAASAFTAAHEEALRAGLVPARVRALSELGILDGLRSADPQGLRSARDLAAEVGMLGTVAMLDLQIAATLSVREGLVAARAAATQAADSAERLHLNAVAASALVFVAGGFLAQGRRSDMRRALLRAEELNADSVDVQAWGASLHAMAHLLDGDNRSALEGFEEAIGMLRKQSVASSTAWWGVWVVLRTAAEGEVPGAGPEQDLALVQGANAAALGYARAIQAGMQGLTDQAQAAVRDADLLVAEAPHWRHLMQLLVAQSMQQAGWGDPVPLARECLLQFEQGEPLLATLARNLLRRAGVAVPRRREGTDAVPATLRQIGITAREMEVLLLVSENLTNGEIAKRLFLSPRTVETHLKHLMQKLAVGRRGELSRAVRSVDPGAMGA